VRLLLLLLFLLVGACAPVIMGAGPAVTEPALGGNAFTMADGASLPYRAWLPEGEPRAVLLGVHGFGDYSVNYLDIPAPIFTQQGVALYAYDQRGFGAAPNRGFWPGAETLVADAKEVARLLRARHPGVPLYLMGESMGVAVLLVAATSADPPPVDGYILQSPAVRGRQAIGLILSGLLEAVGHTVPALSFRNSSSTVRPTDNDEAMRRWSRDPLTTKEIRVDAIYGLVGLMDEAVAALPRFKAPALVLYGGRDDLVPDSVVRQTLRSMSPAAPVRVAYYPGGFHLLLRDRERAKVATDILAWMQNHDAALPSGAERPRHEETTP
jgi:alpha-beta hydrolase superfamily lysophospholipase